jgi:hypothetical protein
MGSTFSSIKTKDKKKTILKTENTNNNNKNNFQKINDVPKSATGRHSLNMEILTKNLELDENENIEKGRNSLRLSLMKTFRHKAPIGKMKKILEDDPNEISNIEFDYNKIFALLYRKENDPFEKSDYSIIEKYKNMDKERDYIKKDSEGVNKNEKENKSGKEFHCTCTCRKKNKIERKEENFKSFITAISNENTEDFLEKQNEESEKLNIISDNKNGDKIYSKENNLNNTNNSKNDLIDYDYIKRKSLNKIEEEKEDNNKNVINTNINIQKLDNFSFEDKEKEKNNIKIRKNNFNIFNKSGTKRENKRESLNLGMEDFDENLKKKLEKNFQLNGDNSKELNEINININDLTINLKSSNQSVKFSNDILYSEEEIKLKEDIEKIEKEKLNEENNTNNNNKYNGNNIDIDLKENKKLRERCDFCRINLAKNKRSFYQKSFIKTNEIENDLLLKINNNKNNNHNSINSLKHLRQSYFTRLICSDTWVPNLKKKSHNTIIIFDWDDTLLCTTFLTPNGIFYDNLKIDKKDLEKITKLESLTYDILKTSIECGDTFIITNAAPGWVEYSTKRFYPKVFPLLSKLNILSARGEFEKKFPRDSRQWKILTFLRLLKIVDINLITNFICLGDSVIEMEAAHIFASRFSKIFIKTVKFREYPSPEELFKQLQLIASQFYSIYSSVKNLTIKVERKNKPNISKSNYTSFDNNNSNYDISQIRNSLDSQIGSDMKKN